MSVKRTLSFTPIKLILKLFLGISQMVYFLFVTNLSSMLNNLSSTFQISNSNTDSVWIETKAWKRKRTHHLMLSGSRGSVSWRNIVCRKQISIEDIDSKVVKCTYCEKNMVAKNYLLYLVFLFILERDLIFRIAAIW